LILIDTGPGYRSDAPRAVWNERAERISIDLEKKGTTAARGLALAARGILVQHDGRVLESLSAIAVPALIVVGANDSAFLAGSRYMAEKIPGAVLEVIADAGHSPNAERPEEFARATSAFLRAIGSS
jgi:pimeloyl-ACP methyl ester carboxylesterase